MKPNVLIFRTAGTNCDKETEFAFRQAGARTKLLHINCVKKNKDLSSYQILCFPGGFSYGDDLGAGKIFSLELLLWLKDELARFIERESLMLGICNGFQIMVKTGILPHADFSQKATLDFNDSARFEDRWVYLNSKFLPTGKAGKIKNSKLKNKKPEKIWTKGLPPVIEMPVAHGEGRFVAPAKIIEAIEKNNQVVFRYCDRQGKPAGYPFNPNGSINDIAGITDPSGRVLGLMPHPERAMFKHQLPFWYNSKDEPWGFKLFENAVNYFK